MPAPARSRNRYREYGPADAERLLRALLVEKREELVRRMAEMRYLDRRLARLASDLE